MATQRKDNPALVIVDCGNDNMRIIALVIINGRLLRYEIMIPHAVQTISSPEDMGKQGAVSDWENAQAEASGASGRKIADKTYYVKYKTADGVKAFKVGSAVRMSRNPLTIYGTDKYSAGYFDALIGLLLNEAFPVEHFPKGHDNLYIAYGFPSKMYNSYNQVVRPLVDKVHLVENLDGVKRKFVPAVVQGNEETFSGLAQMQSRIVKGQIRTADGKLGAKLSNNDSMIICDFGGFEGTMALAYYDEDMGIFKPDYETTQFITGGIGKVRMELRPVLFNKFQKLGLNVAYQHLTDAIINGVIEKRSYSAGNKTIDLSKEVDSAMSYVAEVRRIYRQAFSNGALVRFVGITGGTIVTLEHELLNAVPHDNIVLSADKKDIVWANARGMLQVFIDSLNEKGILPPEFESEVMLV